VKILFEIGGEAPVLYIVVPCYNEEEVLSETAIQLTHVLVQLMGEQLLSHESKLLFIDDGSKDHTWELIDQLSKENSYVKGLKLSKNVGHQNALLAGLYTASNYSDCVISIDADLQDDVNVIKDFILKYLEGYEIVYGVRSQRAKDTFFKRGTAQTFYKLLNYMGVNVVYNHADYRLLSRRVLKHLKEFKETNLFIRGIITLNCFKSTNVYYERNERFAGESKYPLKKMLAFAFDGITSFSVVPIRLITAVGVVLFLFSILMSGYTLIEKILGHTISGWTSIMLSIWFIGCFQLIGIGLIGEYIGKIFNEVKARPKFIIEINQFEQDQISKENTYSIGLNQEKELLSI
jgi:polyisoprenyl-phosphate glycosyltransferase